MREVPEEGYVKEVAELQSLMEKKGGKTSTHRIALREAMCKYVVTEKARDTPPATILRFVTETLQNAEKGTEGAAEELAQMLIDWCDEFQSPLPQR